VVARLVVARMMKAGQAWRSCAEVASNHIVDQPVIRELTWVN
jgi:hypothetical protein